MNDLEVLNEVLMAFAKYKKMGVREKIVRLEKFLKAFKKYGKT
jgi:hypothetical protein